VTDIKGFVFNVERFTLHDGPGIRTTVFLKGCPLQCAWCSNPESQLLLPQLAYFQDKCNGCGSCLTLCPHGAITVNDSQKSVNVGFDLCDGCGKCADDCIPQALVMMGESKTASEIAAEVIKDKPFYSRSGGGMTLSGGEPLAQAAFSAEILRLCKNAGIHTAIQTCGYADKADFDLLLPHLDLVIFDLKLMDTTSHQNWTGKPNQLILENLAYLNSKNKEIVLQIPLVPGVNDSVENLTASFQLAKSLASVKGVSLLVYHPLGAIKYARMGRTYELSHLSQPDGQYLKEKSEWAAQFGVPLVQFNG
jgi:pyruvate formate lyase activating enzyme